MLHRSNPLTCRYPRGSHESGLAGTSPMLSEAFVRLRLDDGRLARLESLGYLQPGVANPEVVRDAAAAALAAMLQLYPATDLRRVPAP
jgi:hypothetical protein